MFVEAVKPDALRTLLTDRDHPARIFRVGRHLDADKSSLLAGHFRFAWTGHSRPGVRRHSDVES